MFFRLFQIHISCVFFSFCLVLFLYLALVLAFVFDSTVNRRSIAWAYAVLYVWWHRWFFFRSSLSFFRLSYNTISSGSMSQNVPLKIHSNISWLHTHRASHQSEHIKVSKQMEGERERKKMLNINKQKHDECACKMKVWILGIEIGTYEYIYISVVIINNRFRVSVV